jgi:hypothetical protein
MAKPMSELLRKDAPFVMTERLQSAFEALKSALCSEQVLAYTNFDSQFILKTDWSKTDAAAIMSQVQDCVERPISFASRQLNPAESRYSASELDMLAGIRGTHHFRYYLYGKQFVLRTHHAALKYMHNFAGNNSRLLRWSPRLSRFDFVVDYRPGTRIKYADALSRAVQAVTQDLEISRDVVKEAQEEDKFCQSLKPGPESGGTEYFKDEEGLIFRRRKNGENQLVVLLILARRIFATNHNSMTVAHPERGRTLDILCLRFYWPGMRAHVEDYVRNCHECQRLKPRHEFKAPLGEAMEPTQPWDVVAMGICGSFPITANKNRYLLTFIDHLMKYAEAVPLTTMSAPVLT